MQLGATVVAQDALTQRSDKVYSKPHDAGDLGIPEVFPSASVKEHENSVDALTVCPSTDKEFATGSHDHTIKIWDAPAVKCRTTLRGHDKGIWSLKYDTSGCRLLSTSPDYTAKIWDVKSGKCADTLRGHDFFVSTLLT